MLGPWPVLELIRAYLPFLVSGEIVLAVILLKRAQRSTKAFAARVGFVCYLTLTGLLVTSIFKTLLTVRPQVEPELLALFPQRHSNSNNFNQSVGPNIQEAFNSFNAQILVLPHSLRRDRKIGTTLAGYQTVISLPELDLELFFKGSAQVLADNLSSLVQGLDAWRSDKTTAKASAKTNGGLIKFQLAKQESNADLNSSDDKAPLNGYLAFMRLPDGDTLHNLRESKAYLRRLGALVRHLEGPIFILLDSRLSLFQKQISYLEKVGRVKMATMPGFSPFIFLPSRNLIVFKR